jgi:hypothetical protein
MQVLLLSNCNPHNHRTNICETNMVMTKLITHQNVQPCMTPSVTTHSTVTALSSAH